MATSDLQYLKDENRFGEFLISKSHLFDSDVRAFLGQCVIVRAEYRVETEGILYLAFHPDFPANAFGEFSPLYWLIKTPSGEVRFESNRKFIEVEGTIDYSRGKR